VIEGRIIAKKNSRRTIKSGRSLPSKKYEEWHKEASFQLLLQRAVKFPVQNDLFIKILFFFPDNRKTDLSNKAESVMDLLVDCGVLDDDNWKVVGSLYLRSIGVDKKNPRAEIYIEGGESYPVLTVDMTIR
jgi:Holliday junction resolvase RusA-like endonuclease